MQHLWAYSTIKSRYVNHHKAHNQNIYKDVLPSQPTAHTCSVCGLVCKSAGGLNRHTKIHKNAQKVATMTALPIGSKLEKYKCYICETEAWLISHLGAHDREAIT